MALCDSHSGSHWLSLPLSGILWPSLAHYCSLISRIQPLIGSQGPCSALIADATMTHFLPLWCGVKCPGTATGLDCHCPLVVRSCNILPQRGLATILWVKLLKGWKGESVRSDLCKAAMEGKALRRFSLLAKFVSNCTLLGEHSRKKLGNWKSYSMNWNKNRGIVY